MLFRAVRRSAALEWYLRNALLPTPELHDQDVLSLMYALPLWMPRAHIRKDRPGEDGENEAVPAFASFASKYTGAGGSAHTHLQL